MRNLDQLFGHILHRNRLKVADGRRRLTGRHQTQASVGQHDHELVGRRPALACRRARSTQNRPGPPSAPAESRARRPSPFFHRPGRNVFPSLSLCGFLTQWFSPVRWSRGLCRGFHPRRDFSLARLPFHVRSISGPRQPAAPPGADCALGQTPCQVPTRPRTRGRRVL